MEAVLPVFNHRSSIGNWTRRKNSRILRENEQKIRKKRIAIRHRTADDETSNVSGRCTSYLRSVSTEGRIRQHPRLLPVSQRNCCRRLSAANYHWQRQNASSNCHGDLFNYQRMHATRHRTATALVKCEQKFTCRTCNASLNGSNGSRGVETKRILIATTNAAQLSGNF